MVRDRRGGDKGVDFGKGVRRDDIYGLECGGQICVVREGCKIDYKEDETVFAAVVGERQGGEAAGR